MTPTSVQRTPVATAAKARRPRADAMQNRQAILAAAQKVFEAEGVLAPLDNIAMLAGVGNATLYRNFPTRDDLLLAVIQASFDDALAHGETLSQTLEPGIALAEWLIALAWRLHIWHDLPHCLASAHNDPSAPLNDANRPMIDETARLLHAAQRAGQATDVLTGEEVFELVLALSWAIDRYGDSEAAARRRVNVGTTGIFVALKLSESVA
jgi:AcrR family transcriptional regulator